MSELMPLVSIIIPVYNGGNYLKKAIDSALRQTYLNIEVIVVNDGSTDNGYTESIALSYGKRIRYFYKENGGVSSAINLGINKMMGEYFSWLSHDDEYIDTKIEKQIEKLRKDGTIAICSERLIDKNTKYLTPPRDYSILASKGVIDWKEELSLILSKRSFSGCSLLIPKYVFEKVGLFDERLTFNQDFDMWLRICFEGYSWVYLNEVGVLSRVHEQQVTQTRRDLFYRDSNQMGKRLIPQLLSYSDKRHNYLYLYAKFCAKYALNKNLDYCKLIAKEKRLFSWYQKIILNIIAIYGRMRPKFRKIYYRVLKKVKI